MAFLMLSLSTPQPAQAENSIDDFSDVSHWTCDETSGIRYDSNTTNSNDLSDNNTVSYATGLLGNACDFEKDGSEFLSINHADQTGLQQTTDFSVSLWFKTESLPDGIASRGLFGKGIIAGDANYYAILNDNSGTKRHCVAVYDTQNQQENLTICKNHAFSNATWYHWLWVFDEDTFTSEIYINGSSIGTAVHTGYSGTLSTASGKFWIGTFLENSAYYFDGLIDEITFFSTALTATEAQTLYNTGTPLPYTLADTATTSSSTTATSTSSINSDDIVFALAVIIFFLTFIWFGFIISAFKKAV